MVKVSCPSHKVQSWTVCDGSSSQTLSFYITKMVTFTEKLWKVTSVKMVCTRNENMAAIGFPWPCFFASNLFFMLVSDGVHSNQATNAGQVCCQLLLKFFPQSKGLHPTRLVQPYTYHRVGTKRRYYDSVQLDTTILLWGFIMEHDTTYVHMTISSLNKHLSNKICSRCSRRRYKEPFRATHVYSCVVVIASTSRDRRIRAEIWRSKI